MRGPTTATPPKTSSNSAAGPQGLPDEASVLLQTLIEDGDLAPFQWDELEDIARALDAQHGTTSLDFTSFATPIALAEGAFGYVPNPTQAALGLPWYTDDQKHIMDSVAVNPVTLVLSGNALGKTFTAALCAFWLWCRGYRVITTAPTYRQVKELLWAEIRTLRARALMRGITLPGEWAESATLVRDPRVPKHTLQGLTARRDVTGGGVVSALSGLHHDLMAVVIDEAVGVDREVFETADRLAMADPTSRMLYIGNPTDPQSYCYELERARNRDGSLRAYTIHMSAENHPNVIHDQIVIPGAVTREFVDLQFTKGGSRDSAFFRVSVLGEWPTDVEDALIAMSWVDAARERAEAELELHAQPELEDRPGGGKVRTRVLPRLSQHGIALGLDVAGEGKDLTVLTGIHKPYDNSLPTLFYPQLRGRKCWHIGRDHTEAVALVMDAIRQLPRVSCVAIDDTGLGAAVGVELARRAHELPQHPLIVVKGPFARPQASLEAVRVFRINFGARPAPFDEERLAKMRDSLYWAMREALRNNQLNLPTFAQHILAAFPEQYDLFAQLCAPKMWTDARGLLHVIDRRAAPGKYGSDAPHDISRSLPALSPDLAHSALLAWWAWLRIPEHAAVPVGPEAALEARRRSWVEHQMHMNSPEARASAVRRLPTYARAVR